MWYIAFWLTGRDGQYRNASIGEIRKKIRNLRIFVKFAQLL